MDQRDKFVPICAIGFTFVVREGKFVPVFECFGTDLGGPWGSVVVEFANGSADLILSGGVIIDGCGIIVDGERLPKIGWVFCSIKGEVFVRDLLEVFSGRVRLVASSVAIPAFQDIKSAL